MGGGFALGGPLGGPKSPVGDALGGPLRGAMRGEAGNVLGGGPKDIEGGPVGGPEGGGTNGVEATGGPITKGEAGKLLLDEAFTVGGTKSLTGNSQVDYSDYFGIILTSIESETSCF